MVEGIKRESELILKNEKIHRMAFLPKNQINP
jgi:hypothetical protein